MINLDDLESFVDSMPEIKRVRRDYGSPWHYITFNLDWKRLSCSVNSLQVESDQEYEGEFSFSYEELFNYFKSVFRSEEEHIDYYEEISDEVEEYDEMEEIERVLLEFLLYGR